MLHVWLQHLPAINITQEHHVHHSGDVWKRHEDRGPCRETKTRAIHP